MYAIINLSSAIVHIANIAHANPKQPHPSPAHL